MVAQSLLPYQLEEDSKSSKLTGLAGLSLCLDLAHIVGLCDAIKEHVKTGSGSQGWSDTQLLTTLKA